MFKQLAKNWQFLVKLFLFLPCNVLNEGSTLIHYKDRSNLVKNNKLR